MAIERMRLIQRMGNFLRSSTLTVKIGLPVLGALGLTGCAKPAGNEFIVPSGQNWAEVAKIVLKDNCGVAESVLADPKKSGMVDGLAGKLKAANAGVELPDDAVGSFTEWRLGVPKGHEFVRIPISACAGIGGAPECGPAVVNMGPLGEVEWGKENEKVVVKGDFNISSPRDKVAIRYGDCGILISDFEIKGGKLVSLSVDSRNALMVGDDEKKSGKNFYFVLVDGDKGTLSGSIKVKPPKEEPAPAPKPAPKKVEKKGPGWQPVPDKAPAVPDFSDPLDNLGKKL